MFRWNLNPKIPESISEVVGKSHREKMLLLRKDNRPLIGSVWESSWNGPYSQRRWTNGGDFFWARMAANWRQTTKKKRITAEMRTNATSSQKIRQATKNDAFRPEDALDHLARFVANIDDIKTCGFGRNDKYVHPNQLKIAVRQLKRGWNDRTYLRRVVRLLGEYKDWAERHESEERFNHLYALLANNGLLHDYTATKAGALSVCKEIEKDYDAWHHKRSHRIVRIVDFNQGLDARLATPAKMRKLSEICIRPLRIAFDDWKYRAHYVRAIKLGAENGIVNLSNYLLYNFKDTPEDLYNRLLLNIDLCDALGVNIYSFPMKYHPITDPEYFSNRDYVGNHWNRKFIRTIQSVLNSTHGKIGRGRTFFFKAFGRNLEEFHDLLYMPEAFIIRRWDAEICGLKAEWIKARKIMSAKERALAEDIVKKNIFVEDEINKHSARVKTFLSYYLIRREDIPKASEKDKESHIARFEASCTTEVSDICRELLARC
jgi:hypothetical protein